MKTAFLLLIALFTTTTLNNTSAATLAPSETSTMFMFPNRDDVLASFDLSLKGSVSNLTLHLKAFVPLAELGKMQVYVSSPGVFRMLIAEGFPVTGTNANEGAITWNTTETHQLTGPYSHLWVRIENLPTPANTGDTIETMIEKMTVIDGGKVETISNVRTVATVRGIRPLLQLYTEPEGPNIGNMVVNVIGIPEQKIEVFTSTDFIRWSSKGVMTNYYKVAVDLGKPSGYLFVKAAVLK